MNWRGSPYFRAYETSYTEVVVVHATNVPPSTPIITFDLSRRGSFGFI